MNCSRNRLKPLVSVSAALFLGLCALVAKAEPVASWPMNEGSGTTITDATGNGLDGTLVNGPQWAGDRGLDFDGIDDYVDLGGLDVTGNAITITAWFRADNLANCASRDCRIVSKATSTSTDDHYLMVSTIKQDTVTRLRFRLKTGGVTTTLKATTGDLQDNEWVHVAAVYDGATMKLYKDGIEVGSIANTGNITTDNSIPVWIGGNPSGETDRPWDGQIDDVRIYNHALSDTEIVAEILGINQPPVADAGGPYTGATGTMISFDGSGSSDIDGDSLTYSWDFGDGSAPGSGQNTTHAYTVADTYTVSLVVNDGTADSVESTATVTVSGESAAYTSSGGPLDTVYYLLNPKFESSGLQVMSLSDGNSIEVGGQSLTLDEHQVDGFTAGPDLSAGAMVKGTRPFTLSSTVTATDLPVPGRFIGKNFVVPHNRGRHTYYLLSPYTDARVTITVSGTPSVVTALRGQVFAYDAGTLSGTSGVIQSDAPILVSHLADNAIDAYPVPPVSKEIWGVRSNTAAVGAFEDNTTITAYASSGAFETFVLNTGDYRNLSLPNGAEGTGSAIHVVADKPVAGIQVADSDGSEATAFLPTAYLATHYGIPVNAQYIAVVCPEAGTTVSLYTGSGSPDSKPCNGDTLIPGKAYFGSSTDGLQVAAGAWLKSNRPVYVYYEASAANDEHNLLGRKHAYFVLNSRTQDGAMDIVSLADNNLIRAGSTELVLNKHERGVIPAGADLAPGMEISGSEAFSLGSSRDGTDMPVPISFAGDSFVIPQQRYAHTLMLLSPYGDAMVEWSQGSGQATPVVLPEGQVVEVAVGSDTTLSTVLRADRPILVTHRGNTSSDVYAVPPASMESWGVRSNTAVLGATEDGTQITVYASSGESANYTLDKGQKKTIGVGSTGSQGQGAGLYVVADKPVAAYQVGDGDGAEITAFWSSSFLGTQYGIPVDAQYVAVVCPEPATSITLTDGGNTQQQDCFGSTTNPGKVYFGSSSSGVHINAGAVLSSNHSVYVIYEASSSNDEKNLLGYYRIENNQAPTAVAGGPYSGVTGGSISFDGSGSSDPDGDALTYSWDFGDGSASGAGVNPSHTYASIGTYTVTLTVNDGGTDSAPATAAVTVNSANQAPIADAGGPYGSVVDGEITFNGSGSSDPNGDSLTYSWDFGDGSTPRAGVSPSHVYTAAGSYTATLTVSDGILLSEAAIVNVTVSALTEPSLATGSGIQYVQQDTYTITGTARPGETVNLYVNDSLVAPLPVDSQGNYQNTVNLQAGLNSIYTKTVSGGVESQASSLETVFYESQPSTSEVVGVIPGDFTVSPDGAATYSIPIQLPPAIAGMQPELSLEYNSQSGNGLLGVGWSLGGFSEISRCPATWDQDGLVDGVDFDGNDRFCINGQRLEPVSSTGECNGAEYRTEVETYSRICANGSAGNGPSWFKVWTKSGQVHEYGNTDDSKVEAFQRSEVSRWAINKISDTHGNSIEYLYDENNQEGTHRPLEIRYSNDTAAVSFGYLTRPDRETSYAASTKTSLQRKLVSIGTRLNNEIVSTYGISYEQSSATQRSRIVSIAQCDALGACKESLGLAWQTGGKALAYVGNGSGGTHAWWNSVIDNGTYKGKSFVGDFNGDGKSDLMMVYRDPNASTVSIFHWQADDSGKLIYVGNGVGGTHAYWDTVIDSPTYKGQAHTGDFNGDGRTDLMMIYRDPNASAVLIYHWHADASGKLNYVGNGSGGTHAWWNTVIDSDTYKGKSFVGDFNGDGKSDLMMVYRDPNASAVSIFHWQADASGKLVYVGNGSGGTHAWWNSVIDNGTYKGKSFVGDFNGDGKSDLMMVYRDPSASTVSIFHWSVEDTSSDLLTVIEKGRFGVTESVSYGRLTDSSSYQKGSDASYPEIDLQFGLNVVQSHQRNNGIGGNRTTSYHYEGLKAHLQGRGFLGFNKVTVTDEQTGIISKTTYHQEHPLTGMAASVETRLSDGTIVREKVNNLNAEPLSGGVRYEVRSEAVAESVYELDGTLVTSTVTQNSNYDSYGNPGRVTVTTTGGGKTFTKVTDSTYDNDTSRWLLGRLRTAKVTSTLPDASVAIRNSSFEYETDTGLLKTEYIEQGNANLELRTDYGYDAYGNKTSVTVQGSGSAAYPITARTSYTAYDYSNLSVNGTYTTVSTNAITPVGHSETSVIDARFGVAKSLTGPNGLTTSWQYDGFGRKTDEVRADGGSTVWEYDWCSGDCPPLAVYKVSEYSTGAPVSTGYFDMLARKIQAQTVGLNGRSILNDTTYDNRGQIVSSTRNYFSGNQKYPTTTLYDDLGRVTQVNSPDGGIIETTYAGLTTTIRKYDPNGDYDQSITRIQNAIGEEIEVRDEANQPLFKQYDPFGNLLRTTDPAGNVISMEYDARGRKIAMDDPDTGHWEYAYDALGQLRWQKNAENQEVTLQYDVLGRMIQRDEDEGRTTWQYDTAAKGIGKLASITAPDFQRSLGYDEYGRLVSESRTLDGKVLTMTTRYDALGRAERLTYPTGFQVAQSYNSDGYQTRVYNAANDEDVFWEASDSDADGNVTTFTLAGHIQTDRVYDRQSGRLTGIATGTDIQLLAYDYDSLGNLKQRVDQYQDLTENFYYEDQRNRLTRSEIVGYGTKLYAYDNLGNITRKGAVSNYVYPTNGVRPHAVTSAGGHTYHYNANGSMINGGGRTIQWTSYNKPKLISKGSTTVAFDYGPDRARFRQTKDTGGTVTTTLYFDKLFEQVSKNGSTESKHYIVAGGSTVAIYNHLGNGGENIRYLHHDHLGSTDVITDELGTIIEMHSFDAFGSRRNINWQDPTGLLSSVETMRGYTGHEQLDEVGLVHMNGRVYDPVLGRFISADPQVQFASNLQSYNRYSYVHNNPLSYTDPSGFGIFSKFKKKFKKTVNRAAEGFHKWSGQKAALNFVKKNRYAQMALQFAAVATGNAWVVVAMNAGLTKLNGGSWGDAAFAGAKAYAFTQVGAPGADSGSGGGSSGWDYAVMAMRIGGESFSEENNDRKSSSDTKGSSLYHEYSYLSRICSRSFEACTVENVWDATKNYSVPFQDGPLYDGVENSIPIIGTVVTRVDNIHYTLKNITMDDHEFRYGTVTRSLLVTQEAIYVHTFGDGVNLDKYRKAANIGAAVYFPYVLDNKIRADIAVRQVTHEVDLFVDRLGPKFERIK